MTEEAEEQPAPTQPTPTQPTPPSRRRPEQTSDDTDRGWGERPDEDAHEQWLREQRPPHWD